MSFKSNLGTKFDNAIMWGQRPLVNALDLNRTMGLIIGVAVSLIVVVSMVPSALVRISNGTGAFGWTGGTTVNPNPVNAAVLTTFQVLLPIAFVVTLALLFLRWHKAS